MASPGGLSWALNRREYTKNERIRKYFTIALGRFPRSGPAIGFNCPGTEKVPDPEAGRDHRQIRSTPVYLPLIGLTLPTQHL